MGADLERQFDQMLEARAPRLRQLVQAGGGAISYAPIAAADAPINSLFHDTADGKLKWKDSGGTANALY